MTSRNCVIAGFVFFNLALATSAWARPELQKSGTCGSAKVVAGVTCSNLKIEMDFSGCIMKSEAKQATKLLCKNDSFIARYDDGKFRYEAEFIHDPNDWQAAKWKAPAPMNQFIYPGNGAAAATTAVTAMAAAAAPAKSAHAAEVKEASAKSSAAAEGAASATGAAIGAAAAGAVSAAGTAAHGAEHAASGTAEKVAEKAAGAVPAPTHEAPAAHAEAQKQDAHAAVEHKEAAAATEAQAAHKTEAAAHAETAAASETKAEAKAEAPAEGLKISAFLDARFSVLSADQDPGVKNAIAESGFGIEDGAIYINYAKGKAESVIDIPFRRAKDIDSVNLNDAGNASSQQTITTVPNESSTNTISIGTDKAQIFGRFKMTPHFIFDMGQFDTPYGVEANDSKDRAFGQPGLIFQQMLPYTHTGAMLEWLIGDGYIKAFGANPNVKGTLGTIATGGNQAEGGAILGYRSEKFRAQAGYMTRNIINANSSATAARNLLDATLGATLGHFSFDLEYTQLTDPSKNTLTPKDKTDLEADATGTLALLTYNFGESAALNLRWEAMTNDPGLLSQLNATDTAVGLQINAAKELIMRLEYVGYSYTSVANVTWNDTRYNFATLVMF